MRTIDELLIGTKYEGAENVDFLCADTYLAHSMAGNRMYQDAKTNAALASLLPATVKALEFCSTCTPMSEMAKKAQEHALVILAIISEVTKAVEGK